MKAWRKTKPGFGAELAAIERPKAGDGEILVKVRAAAICKSDLDVIEWTELVQRGKFPLPVTLGHEFSGEVVEVGPQVKAIKVGDRISADTHNPCGVCHTCRTGNQHICRNGMGVLGRSMNGCFAEYIKLPEIMAVKLPDNVDFVSGALMEPLATALHSLTKAEAWGDSIAVVGVGAIGQMAVDLAKQLGAAKIFAVGRSEAKLALSKSFGADVLIDSRHENFAEVVKRNTRGLGVAGVLEMTGDHDLINQSVEALRVAGRMVQVGMVEGSLAFDNFMYGVAYKELYLTGIFGRRMFETWEMLLPVIEARKIDLTRHVGKLTGFENLLDVLGDFSKTNGRMIMQFPD
ncbi:MAG: alcohol dehydrogenase catalytic domain-containing protein [Planctomycetes bacterium]|nr:alcohol dehydrogenase catalytic domain-containing protein [Planctomycetota bacterium]